MKSEDLIPKFKRKELSPQYLSETFQDDSNIRFGMLLDAVDEYDVQFRLTHIFELMEYKEKSLEYVNELICFLSGEDSHKYLLNEMERFIEIYSPKSNSSKLIFSILKNAFDDLMIVNTILNIEEMHFEGDV